MKAPNSRSINAIIFLGCLGLILVALYMEYSMGLEPCPLCILQRILILATGLVSLIAFLVKPQVRGIRIFGLIGIVLSGIGSVLGVRHLWLQSLPEDQAPACGPGLEYLIDIFTPIEVLKMILEGDGSCAEVVWTFLGISIPGWTLIGFIGLILLNITQLLQPRPD
ncbi:MAG: disulfide bond formation protein B [Candidatus Azotimanducaceae bacterium]|uniref:Disulfide bond formation protein B n=1 Tax=OM182 bacterium TaxID=2510334 RepID=A0A520S5V6_9GAMM|nr:disulfide bond formation protein B [Gammaproteobacteria bacterium]OUV68420.1 MAG: disulfide bond formation protein B [Gammaproteobacteria bacterium TMED133]RZO77779.1 MAG: disulfide bond formation protein B [OM182 bacterium]